MIIKVFITERDGELGWTGDRLATCEEYDKALAYAEHANPKYTLTRTTEIILGGLNPSRDFLVQVCRIFSPLL